MLLAILFIIIGVVARFIPHVNNFTPVLAIALFAGLYLKGRQAIIVPLLLMIISDVFIGFHPTIAFTWGSIILLSLIGLWGKEKKGWMQVLTKSVLGSIVFFLITNFGVFLMYHPHTLAELNKCYTLAIPFFRHTLISTLVYSAVLYAGYEFLASRVKSTKYAKLLLP